MARAHPRTLAMRARRELHYGLTHQPQAPRAGLSGADAEHESALVESGGAHVGDDVPCRSAVDRNDTRRQHQPVGDTGADASSASASAPGTSLTQSAWKPARSAAGAITAASSGPTTAAIPIETIAFSVTPRACPTAARSTSSRSTSRAQAPPQPSRVRRPRAHGRSRRKCEVEIMRRSSARRLSTIAQSKAPVRDGFRQPARGGTPAVGRPPFRWVR